MGILVQFKINQEENIKLQNAYYKKLGLENLINNGGMNDSIVIDYGKACAELSDLGSEIIASHYEKAEEITAENSWEIDFATATFTINK